MLAGILRAELAALSELERLLIVELEALKMRNLGKLENLIAVKEHCVDQSAQRFQDRCAQLRSLGFEISRAGTERCIESFPDSQRQLLRDLWADVQATGVRAKRRNEINGAIMAASRCHTKRALAMLQGQDPLTSLYGHDAQATVDRPSQPLARV